MKSFSEPHSIMNDHVPPSAKKSKTQSLPLKKIRSELWDCAPDGLILVSEEGTIAQANPQIERIFGFESGELKGAPLSVLVPELLREKHEQQVFDYFLHPVVRQMGIGRVLDGRCKNGTLIPVEISLSPVILPDASYVIAAVRDVTLQRKLERDLKRSNDYLEKFALLASHDLQAPLRSIALHLQYVERASRSKLDAESARSIAFAISEARRLQALIKSLLAYSQLDVRPKIIDEVDCNEVINEVKTSLEASLRQTQGRIVASKLPIVRADRERLRSLFQNLISNSLKYRSATAPLIRITAKREKKHWLFWIQDNGIGIPTEHQDSIFHMFVRLHTGSETPGSGIGLALCKNIVEGHGGKLWVESSGGKGATFYFTIPAGRRKSTGRV